MRFQVPNQGIWLRVTIFCLVFVTMSVVSAAQGRREVHGMIRNEAGGPIEGAAVSLTDSQGTHSTMSDRDGHYRVEIAGEGTATLSVRAAGFATVTRKVLPGSSSVTFVFVTLRVAADERVDVRSDESLEPGQIMSTMTLSGRSLLALPDNPEELLQTLRMLAGTTGTRADQVAFYIDGLPIDRRLPPKEVIQSIRVDVNALSAEFSEPGSSRVEIITKPASDKFHGDGRFDFNDQWLTAANLFEPSPADVQLRTYVGYVGGPIVKNRLGILAYGGLWNEDGNTVVNATTVDPGTLQPVNLRQNVATPTVTKSYSLKTEGLVTDHHIVSAEIAQDQQQRVNAGLESGFDLPERAYSSAMLDRAATLRVTSAFSDHTLNEFRVRYSRHQLDDQAMSGQPAILVIEAFNGGGNQDNLFRTNATDELAVNDVVTLTGSRHAFRIGGVLDNSSIALVDRSNFNGTFIFGSDVVRDSLGRPILGPGGPTAISPLQLYQNVLAQTPGYLPTLFSVVRGEPSVTFSVFSGAGFVQDDWRVSPHATISLGLRTEVQQEIATHVNIAPRAGVAWALSDRSTLRAGIGVFYTPIPIPVISDVLRLDGEHAQQYVVDRPTFFPAVPVELPSAQTMTTIRREAAGITTPSTLLTTVSFDHQIVSHVFGSIGYSWKRGMNLLLTTAAAPPILLFESAGASNTQEVRGTVNASVGSWLTLFGNYVWTNAQQNTDGPYTAPSNSHDLAAEWGPAPLPQHQLTVGGSFGLPGHLTASPLLRMASALPFNITTGNDNNGDTLFTDRPAFATPGSPNAILTPYGAFNLYPLPGAAVIPRNFGVGPSEFTLDLVMARSFEGPLDGHSSVFVTVNNLTNHINYAPFNGVLTAPFFGTANRALNPRRITLSFRYEF
jgi:hypothetical protein